jgi:hypothetical protein
MINVSKHGVRKRQAYTSRGHQAEEVVINKAGKDGERLRGHCQGTDTQRESGELKQITTQHQR